MSFIPVLRVSGYFENKKGMNDRNQEDTAGDTIKMISSGGLSPLLPKRKIHVIQKTFFKIKGEPLLSRPGYLVAGTKSTGAPPMKPINPT
jgi:hypothetical protein